MAKNYAQHTSRRRTPQTEKIPGKEHTQTQNWAGGVSFALDRWKMLDRFLILGTENGGYYASEQKMTREAAQHVEQCIREDGLRVVNRTVEISDAGRAVKNDPAIFVMALCMTVGDKQTREAARDAIPKVCRIGTHIFHFAAMAEELRGWGRGLRKAVAQWYLEKPVSVLALQAVKYPQRDGWSHRDLLRLSHPKPDKRDADRRNVFQYIRDKNTLESAHENDLPKIIEGTEQVKRDAAKGVPAQKVAETITSYKLPRECVPTQYLNSPEVWHALLQNMPMTAMIRNLGKMSSVGLLTPNSDAAKHVRDTLRDRDTLRKARVHPLSVLVALKTYQQGGGMRGSLTWSPVNTVFDALDDAFYAAFDNVQPSGKRYLLGIDISGSMSGMAFGGIAGMPISPREGAAAMAMVTARAEEDYHIMGFGHQFRELGITAKDSLDSACRKASGPFMMTDCALPMIYAEQNRIPVDMFCVYTDAETYYGKVHPSQALEQYRKTMGIDAKLVCVGMVGNPFSIADPNDAGMLDVVGFSTDTPQVISEFASG